MEFASLDAGELPRSKPVRAKKAQLVVSPDRGYEGRTVCDCRTGSAPPSLLAHAFQHSAADRDA
jgi:hypothetical protein